MCVCVHALSRTRFKLPCKLFEFELACREDIVSNMVRMKYGQGMLMSAKMITEAEMSLSSWMAGHRTAVVSSNFEMKIVLGI